METRRSFIKKTAVAGTGVIVAPTIIPARAFGANDRINAAVSGSEWSWSKLMYRD